MGFANRIHSFISFAMTISAQKAALIYICRKDPKLSRKVFLPVKLAKLSINYVINFLYYDSD